MRGDKFARKSAILFDVVLIELASLPFFTPSWVWVVRKSGGDTSQRLYLNNPNCEFCLNNIVDTVVSVKFHEGKVCVRSL